MPAIENLADVIKLISDIKHEYRNIFKNCIK